MSHIEQKLQWIRKCDIFDAEKKPMHSTSYFKSLTSFDLDCTGDCEQHCVPYFLTCNNRYFVYHFGDFISPIFYSKEEKQNGGMI